MRYPLLIYLKEKNSFKLVKKWEKVSGAILTELERKKVSETF
jgi:hypothetical protein